MKVSDFDEVSRLMMIREKASSTLRELDGFNGKICSLVAIVFGVLDSDSNRLRSRSLTIDLEKIEFDSTDLASTLTTLIENTVRSYLIEELK